MLFLPFLLIFAQHPIADDFDYHCDFIGDSQSCRLIATAATAQSTRV
jgi:hypothetical protein